VQDVGGCGGRVDHRSAVQARHWQEVDLHLGDDAEVPFAAAQGPEQIGVARGVHVMDGARTVDQGGASYMVGRESIGAREWSGAAAQGIADRTDS
jgi:hypothetical protein